MKKRAYKKPVIKSIRIDNQISMVMLSDPPTEDSVNVQHSNSVDPYKVSNA